MDNLEIFPLGCRFRPHPLSGTTLPGLAGWRSLKNVRTLSRCVAHIIAEKGFTVTDEVASMRGVTAETTLRLHVNQLVAEDFPAAITEPFCKLSFAAIQLVGIRLAPW